jgi:hypothetical protein
MALGEGVLLLSILLIATWYGWWTNADYKEPLFLGKLWPT